MAKKNGKNGKSVKKLSCLDAAYKVLAQCHGKLNPKALAAKMIAKRFWTTAGATPHQTVAAGMNVEISKPHDKLTGAGLLRLFASLPAEGQIIVHRVLERLFKLGHGLALKRHHVTNADDLAVENPGVRRQKSGSVSGSVPN